jgi:hypothetical protein
VSWLSVATGGGPPDGTLFQLPDVGDAVDTQSIVFSLHGAANIGVIIEAGAGTNLADPNNPGQFVGVAGSATITGIGIIFRIKYSAADKTWYAW